ncbi:MAG: flagellar hook-length control protein FliK [Desulfuromonadaceae bacterium]|nr:flagellar hook-length control protein FliK [Desulfuromonadaceae bacterium]
MINGQLNAASLQQTTPLAALEPVVPVAAAINGGADFAGMLGGIQSLAKEKVLPDSGHAEELLSKSGKDQLHLEAGGEDAAVDLLALLQVPPQITAASEPVAAKSEDSEKTDVTADVAALHSEASGVTSQMALAAYSQPGRMPEVNILAQIPVDTLQKAATATEEQPVLIAAISDKIQGGQAAAAALQEETSVQAPVVFSAKATTAPAPEVQIVPKGTHVVDLFAAAPAEKSAAGSTPPAAPPAAAALAGNIPAAAVQEAHTARQPLNPEQQLEKDRTGGEPVAVKEMAAAQQSAASAGESSLGSDTPQSGDSNQMLEQQMRGQLNTEHQKVATLSPKGVSAEASRQNVPEQVMHQVKDRLLQHDLKPGNQQITLTLSPDSLGELKMNLNLQGQKLSVEILTENRTVRDAIVLHADALKESLARQNITMESFDVTTGGKGSAGQGQNQNAWRELAKEQQQQQLWTSPRGYRTAQTDLPTGHGAYQRQQGQSMLDIHY